MEISEQVIKVLDAVCDKFGIVIDWTSDNVIPYIQQLGNKIITYDICVSCIGIVLSLIMLIIAFVLSKNMIKASKNKYNKNYKSILKDSLCGEEVVWIISIFIVSILSIFGIVILSADVHSLIQDMVFPEKTIIEFITPYIK